MKKLLAVVALIVLGVGVVAITVNAARRRKAKTTRAKTTRVKTTRAKTTRAKTTRAKATRAGKRSRRARKTRGAKKTRTVIGKIPAPNVGQSYTVQQLLTLINTNNPDGTSSFLVPIDATGKPIPAGGDITAIVGSVSVGRAGLQSVVNDNKEAVVVLKTDPALISFLLSAGRLDDATSDPYSRILLCLEIGGYRFYLVEPFPGRIIKGILNPAQNNIDKWGV